MAVKLFIVIHFFIQGHGNPFLHCLGKEEEMIHQAKDQGPIYLLNQWIISDVVAMNIHVKRKYLDDICKSFSPSVAFLRLFLMEGKSIFTKESSSVQGQLTGKLPDLFTGYLLQIQASLPQAGCLERQSPHVSYYLNRFKYLQGEISAENLLKDPVRIRHVFKSLENFDQMVKACHPSTPAAFRGKNHRDGVKTK